MVCRVLAKGGWKEISYLLFRLMAATISAVQPSLCLALTSAPSDNSLERDRNIFNVWFIMDIRVEDMKNQQGLDGFGNSYGPLRTKYPSQLLWSLSPDSTLPLPLSLPLNESASALILPAFRGKNVPSLYPECSLPDSLPILILLSWDTILAWGTLSQQGSPDSSSPQISVLRISPCLAQMSDNTSHLCSYQFIEGSHFSSLSVWWLFGIGTLGTQGKMERVLEMLDEISRKVHVNLLDWIWYVSA